MIALALLVTQARVLWNPAVPGLKLDYRIEVKGEAGWVADQTLDYRVSRRYEGSVPLDRREADPAWDFNFDTTQSHPSLIQTTACKVSILDELRSKTDLVTSWTAQHEARRAMTEATVELASDKKSYRLFFGVGDTLGATDAVKVKTPNAESTLGLTQVPNFRTAKDEFRGGVVTLPKVGRSEFTKSWPAFELLDPKVKLQNRTLRVVLWVKITPRP